MKHISKKMMIGCVSFVIIIVVIFVFMQGSSDVSRKVEKELLEANYKDAYEYVDSTEEKNIVSNESLVANTIARYYERMFMKDCILSNAWLDVKNDILVLLIDDIYYVFTIENNFGFYDLETMISKRLLEEDDDKGNRFNSKLIEDVLIEDLQLSEHTINRLNKLLKNGKINEESKIFLVGNR